MKKTTFHISKMDCPSEEALIRMKLEGLSSIERLVFDIENRRLAVFHTSEDDSIAAKLGELDLGSKIENIEDVKNLVLENEDKVQYRMLWYVLAINLVFFVVEMVTGVISDSMGLVADSLDMFADSIVYSLSLWAVGASMLRKKRVARASGYFQIVLALLGLVEVVRRFVGFDELPDFRFMVTVSLFALIANGISLYLLQKSKSNDAHMRAGMIFTSNDVIINLGVVLAGVLVYFTQSKYPDLIIGSIIFLIVVRGALRILKLSK